MKANELMIGDFVECVDSTHENKVYAQVGAIEEGQTCILVEKDCSNWFLDISLLEPIPLTPEILEKNGFKKFDFHDIEGQHQWSWWLDTLTSVSLWCRELNDDPKDGWMICIEGTLAMCCHKVEYVHELQQTLRICGIEKEIVV